MLVLKGDKMYMRWIKLTVLILLLLSLAIVSGQSLDERAALCGDLAEADCQILLENEAVMDGVNAFAFEASMTLDSEAPEPDSISLLLDASGSMSISSETMDAVLEMEGQAMADATVAILDALIPGMTAELSADLQITSQDETEELSLQVLIKDGIVVLNAEAVAEVTGESMGGMAWFGIDANGLFALLASESGMQDMMKSEMDSHSDMADGIEMAMSRTVTRLADSEVNGVAVAVFESSMDMGHLLALLNTEAAEETAESSETLNATMREYIGLDDHYLYRSEIAAKVVDSSSMTTIDIWLAIDMSDFNVPVSIEIPEDAFVFPVEFLMEFAG